MQLWALGTESGNSERKGQIELGCEEKGANLDFWLGPLGRLRFGGRGAERKLEAWQTWEERLF